MKWQTVHPEPERYNFAPADAIAAFAKAHDQRMRGHTFCWHRSLPDWVHHTVTPMNAEAVLTAHISTVASHYRGLISAWDVVNEAIQLEDGQPDGLRNSFWYQMLGPRYLDIAFKAAHKADPDALLCYNDYGLEKDTHYGESRRTAVLAMLRSLKQRAFRYTAWAFSPTCVQATHLVRVCLALFWQCVIWDCRSTSRNSTSTTAT